MSEAVAKLQEKLCRWILNGVKTPTGRDVAQARFPAEASRRSWRPGSRAISIRRRHRRAHERLPQPEGIGLEDQIDHGKNVVADVAREVANPTPTVSIASVPTRFEVSL
jgi:hypothetical protein